LYLRGVGVYSDRTHFPLPSIVLLDSENEEASDLKVLSWIRDSSVFKNVVVGVLAHGPSQAIHYLCALDPVCFLVSRSDLSEVQDLIDRVAGRSSRLEPFANLRTSTGSRRNGYNVGGIRAA